jgi:monothiol glutaredoxin
MPANPELKQKVEEVLQENRVLLFMKGTPEAPQCGFSMRVVGVLEQMGTEYGAIDVLPILDPLREVTGEISDWRTFPQLYVNGELVGGCDIVEEMAESGELAELFGVEQPQASAATSQPEANTDPQQSPPLQVDGT